MKERSHHGKSKNIRRSAHVDDALGQPGFPVEGGEEIRVGGEAGTDPGAGGDEIGGRAEEGRRIGVGIGGCGAGRLIFLPDSPVPVFCAVLFHGGSLPFPDVSASDQDKMKRRKQTKGFGEPPD